jgi:hypothetical protein
MRAAISASLPALNSQLKSAGVAELTETSVETPSRAGAAAMDDVADDDDVQH